MLTNNNKWIYHEKIPCILNRPLPTVASKYPHDHVYVYLFMLQYISWPEFGLSNIHNNKNIFCTEPLYSTQLEVYNKGINSTSIYFICSWKYSYKNYWVKQRHFKRHFITLIGAMTIAIGTILKDNSTSFSALNLHLAWTILQDFTAFWTRKHWKPPRRAEFSPIFALVPLTLEASTGHNWQSQPKLALDLCNTASWEGVHKAARQ